MTDLLTVLALVAGVASVIAVYAEMMWLDERAARRKAEEQRDYYKHVLHFIAQNGRAERVTEQDEHVAEVCADDEGVLDIGSRRQQRSAAG